MRNDTPYNWSLANPILSKGEVGCAIDSDKGIVTVKIGDGVHHWNELEMRMGTKETELNQAGKTMSEAMCMIADTASAVGISMQDAVAAFQSLCAFGGNTNIDTALQSMQNGTTFEQKQAKDLYKMARHVIEENQEKKNPYLEDFEIPHYEFEDMNIKNLIDF